MQVYSNRRGTPLDDPFFHPLYERCAELDLPIFLHPTAPALSEAPMADYGLIPIVGFLFDTTLAALRLIMSGTLNKHPNVRFVLPHVGSTIPYLIGRNRLPDRPHARRTGAHRGTARPANSSSNSTLTSYPRTSRPSITSTRSTGRTTSYLGATIPGCGSIPAWTS